MKLELHRDPAVFETLKVDWNTLAEKGVTRVPFVSAEYQRAWWQHRGGGEWPEAELLVITARADEGQLIGIAPLFFAKNLDGRPALLFVGSIEISDYLDLVVAREQADSFCAALLDRLTEPDVPDWEVLDLYNIPESSPTRSALARAARDRGWPSVEQVLQPVTVITRPDSWEAYLALLDKKERQEIKRKLRRASGNEEAMTWYRVGPEHNLQAELEAFLELMALNDGKARFLTPVMYAQFTETIRVLHEKRWLLLAFLKINDDRAAAYLCFDFGNRLWVYNSAIDPRFSSLSVGWVLLAHLLQWAIENRRAAFDFMRGPEDYKLRFGGVPGKIYRLQISRRLTIEELGGEPACLMNEFEADFFPPVRDA